MTMTDKALLIEVFDRIQKISIQRCIRWHGEKGLLDWSVLEWAGAMCGEAGEAANVAKKISRAEHEITGNNAGDWQALDFETLDKKLAQECADTFLYLVLLAARRNIDLGTAIIDTFNNKSVQLGFPELL